MKGVHGIVIAGGQLEMCMKKCESQAQEKHLELEMIFFGEKRNNILESNQDIFGH